jgi:hypothetical protein
MANERYALYGVIPTERETNEPMSFEEQNVGDSGVVLIYETDDREEARIIYESGGFERDGVWNVVTRVEDRTKGTVRQQSDANADRREQKVKQGQGPGERPGKREQPQKPLNVDQL